MKSEKEPTKVKAPGNIGAGALVGGARRRDRVIGHDGLLENLIRSRRGARPPLREDMHIASAALRSFRNVTVESKHLEKNSPLLHLDAEAAFPLADRSHPGKRRADVLLRPCGDRDTPSRRTEKIRSENALQSYDSP